MNDATEVFYTVTDIDDEVTYNKHNTGTAQSAGCSQRRAQQPTRADSTHHARSAAQRGMSEGTPKECSSRVKNSPVQQQQQQYQTEEEPVVYTVPTPKVKYQPPDDLVPATVLFANRIQNQPSLCLMTVLFDSGATSTIIHRRCLPPGAVPHTMDQPIRTQTVMGTKENRLWIEIDECRLPEFDQSKRIDGKQQAFVMEGECRYDMIMGHDFLHKVEMNLDFKNKVSQWMGKTIAMRSSKSVATVLDQFYEAAEAELEELDHDDQEQQVAEILDAQYQKVNVRAVADEQTHLTSQQRDDLYRVLLKHERLFDGKLKKFPTDKPVHLELKEGAIPVHKRPYAVPLAHQTVFKKELDRLCDIGVLE